MVNWYNRIIQDEQAIYKRKCQHVDRTDNRRMLQYANYTDYKGSADWELQRRQTAIIDVCYGGI